MTSSKNVKDELNTEVEKEEQFRVKKEKLTTGYEIQSGLKSFIKIDISEKEKFGKNEQVLRKMLPDPI